MNERLGDQDAHFSTIQTSSDVWQALDLKIFHRGLFACIKTTQNIDRMPVVYSPHDPLMVLTCLGYPLYQVQLLTAIVRQQKSIPLRPAGRYLVGCQQWFLHGSLAWLPVLTLTCSHHLACKHRLAALLSLFWRGWWLAPPFFTQASGRARWLAVW